MPKQPSVPSYRLHKARNCAVVTIGGRNFYLGKYNSPERKEKYALLVAEHFSNGRGSSNAHWPDQNSITISELTLRYWKVHVEAYYVNDGRPTDRQHHIRLALGPLRRLYGTTLAQEFGPRKLKAVRHEIIESAMR